MTTSDRADPFCQHGARDLSVKCPGPCFQPQKPLGVNMGGWGGSIIGLALGDRPTDELWVVANVPTIQIPIPFQQPRSQTTLNSPSHRLRNNSEEGDAIHPIHLAVKGASSPRCEGSLLPLAFSQPSSSERAGAWGDAGGSDGECREERSAVVESESRRLLGFGRVFYYGVVVAFGTGTI
ncbi:hypothetical protein JTE90_022511 [Oedothorax gibbosus]|uniref:Uncharacterized protein n=1 Tax=Oedothorax gibbosus TaxID=931172 RepID=A0AAV6V0T2_9ARAC|nr:hypothetical protein JTE90_022511 [Oedothorax gibbosus]